MKEKKHFVWTVRQTDDRQTLHDGTSSSSWGTCNQQSAGQPMRIGWPAYRVVGRPLAPVSNSAGQPTQPFFEVLFVLTRRWRRPSRKC